MNEQFTQLVKDMTDDQLKALREIIGPKTLLPGDCVMIYVRRPMSSASKEMAL